MDLRQIAHRRRVFLRAEAAAAGYDDRAVARAVRCGEWVRVRRGAYTFADAWAAADDDEQHRVLCAAVMRSYGDRVALSHTSAALHHGMRLWDADLRRVHVTRLDGGAGRTEPDVIHHEGFSLGSDIESRDGVLVTRPARAALEAAALLGVEQALVVLDSALHLELCDTDDLHRAHAVLQRWPGMQHVQLALRLADPGGQSVGESRARYLCWAVGLPAPVTQYEVRDGHGRLAGITDLAWPEHGLLGEFDGLAKYGRLLRPGETSADAVVREKQREDLLRELTGWPMLRLVWSDLHRPEATAARLRRFLRAAA